MIRITEKGLHTMQELEDFKRPLHADFATTAELKQREFSGIRINSITQEQELWTVGDLRLSMPLTTIHADSTAWDRAYEAIFKLNDVQTIGVK